MDLRLWGSVPPQAFCRSFKWGGCEFYAARQAPWFMPTID